MSDSMGVLETTGWTPAIVALDHMDKSAAIEVWQVELNDFLGTCVKITGSTDAVRTALETGHCVAETMGGKPVSRLFPRLSDDAKPGVASKVEWNPLIQQNVVHEPNSVSSNSNPSPDSDTAPEILSVTEIKALGFIETQGFTAVFQAVDTACKTAQVEVVGKEKLGGGYVTIVIQGDVAAVRAAIDAATPAVEGLGTLIAAHVIARPSDAVRSLLPQ
ncbi:MAG: BMC domain-containing protein [Planctomycetota bacterium]